MFREGLCEIEICKALKVSRSTFSIAKRDHKELAEIVKITRSECDAEVENSLYKRACGFFWDEITTFTDSAGNKTYKSVAKYQPPSFLASKYILENRQFDKWRSSPETLIEGSVNIIFDKSDEGL
jgi:hypothetical protein